MICLMDMFLPQCMRGNASAHKMSTKYSAVCTLGDVQYFTQVKVPVVQQYNAPQNMWALTWRRTLLGLAVHKVRLNPTSHQVRESGEQRLGLPQVTSVLTKYKFIDLTYQPHCCSAIDCEPPFSKALRYYQYAFFLFIWKIIAT